MGRRAYAGGREINLTAKEFELLELLVVNANKVYSRENLLNVVWGYEYIGVTARWMCMCAACGRSWSPTRPTRSTF